MTIARSKLVNPDTTPWYHTISRCVRGLCLLDAAQDRRKRWLQERLEKLVSIFTIDVAGFGILDNHLHVLVHLDVKANKGLTKEQVLRRWAALHPPRDAQRRPLKDLKPWIKDKLSDHQFVNTIRKRLVDLGWFMKSLKEPLARIINREDDNFGPVWAGRYKSIAVLDLEALLATCVYIDLNPFAAGMAKLPDEARFTSLYERIELVRRQGRLKDLEAARQGSVQAARQADDLETGLWLLPIEDRRQQGDSRVGLQADFTLGSYLLLVDHTSRLTREGKAQLPADAIHLLDRLGIVADHWQQTLQSLFARPRPSGVAFSFHREHLRKAAATRGCHHLANLNGCRA